MVNQLIVDESLASELVKRDWVSSVLVEITHNYVKVDMIEHIRIVVHVDGRVATKDEYLDTCSKILSDPLIEVTDAKFIRQFYDSCIYLHYVDECKDVIDFIISPPYSFKAKDRAKLYSEISGCNMTLKRETISLGSWACEVEG